MIRLSYGSFAPHNAQILTGFNILTNGECEISPKPDLELPPFVIVADIEGNKIAYDTSDGYFNNGAIGNDIRYRRLSEEVNVLYKRDYCSGIDTKELFYKGKIKSLGLNYFCYDNRVKRMYYPGIRYAKKKLKEILHDSFDENWKNYEVKKESEDFSCDVLFLTRLWDPDAKEVESKHIAEDRIQINNMRIEIVRKLRRQYGNKAICGLSDDAYARKLAPELIVTELTKKWNYMEIMKRAKVVVTSLGLHKSNGWKTGEYMSAGRSIVMEKPYYDIPFAQSGMNWLEYSDSEECVCAVDELLINKSRRQEMADANREYYLHHLRPDMLIKSTLVTEKT